MTDSELYYPNFPDPTFVVPEIVDFGFSFLSLLFFFFFFLLSPIHYFSPPFFLFFSFIFFHSICLFLKSHHIHSNPLSKLTSISHIPLNAAIVREIVKPTVNFQDWKFTTNRNWMEPAMGFLFSFLL
jgi:hypothetical protein